MNAILSYCINAMAKSMVGIGVPKETADTPATVVFDGGFFVSIVRRALVMAGRAGGRKARRVVRLPVRQPVRSAFFIGVKRRGKIHL